MGTTLVKKQKTKNKLVVLSDCHCDVMVLYLIYTKVILAQMHTPIRREDWHLNLWAFPHQKRFTSKSCVRITPTANPPTVLRATNVTISKLPALIYCHSPHRIVWHWESITFQFSLTEFEVHINQSILINQSRVQMQLIQKCPLTFSWSWQRNT